jgi:phospholipid/cholesterol/gamma-HCH transport system substrate-binding protein
MIRRTVKIQLVAFLVITVMGVLYAGFDLIGFNKLNPPYVVKVQLAASGGIFSNAEVTYRGVQVGRVGDLRLTPDGVEVDLRMEPDERVPRDTIAIVANKSAVGEQYVDLQPRSSGAPYLRDGDVIELADTAIPIDIQTVLLNLDSLVRSIDKQALTILVSELGDAFEETGPVLQKLIESGDSLVASLEAKLPETVTLIRQGEIVLQTARDTRSDFREFARGLAALSESLADADPDIRTLLTNGVTAARELEALLRPSQRALSTLLGDLVTVNEYTVDRLGGLRTTLDALPGIVRDGPQSIVDGQLHNGLVTDEFAPACDYGSTRRLPEEKTAVTPDVNNACPPGTSGQRGAEYAPKPAGSDSSAPAASRTSGAGVPLAGASSASPAEVRWTGGQQDLLGRRSWLALLLSLF